jgi:hypothetical protein
MRKATAARRLAVLKGVGVAGVFAVAALASGSASAEVLVLNAGASAATNGANLAGDITTANTAGGSNTIVISTGTYAPTAALPTITDPNLTITSNHALQSVSGGGPIISGTGFTSDAPLLAIGSGGGLTLEGIDFRTIGQNGGSFPAIDDGGTLTAYNSAFHGDPAEATIQFDAGSTATLTESLISNNLGAGLDNEGGTVTLNFDTIISNAGGITNNGTTTANYSIISANAGQIGATNCTNPLSASSYDVDTDATCVAPGDTTSKTGGTQTVANPASNGGPTVTGSISSTAGTTNRALGLVPAAHCNLTDQRFFLIPSGNCDAGSYQHGATQDTTVPSCPASSAVITPGPPKQQTITLSDPLSGLGPEGGSISDLSDTEASLTLGNDQADALDGVTIANGTVAAPSTFSTSGPSTASIFVTATKTNQATTTQWSFYATNWAGLTKYCN